MITRLANGMVKRGIDVDILLFDPSIIKYELNPEVSIVDAKAEGTGIKRDLRRIIKIRKYISHKNPDILCCFIVTSLPYAIVANFLKKTKIVGAERGNPKEHVKKDRIRMKMVIPFCDGFIFQTAGARKYYELILKCKSAIIGNIAPTPLQTVVMNASIVKDICTAGRLCKQKDFDTLLRAFSQVVVQIPDARLHIYGEGDELSSLTGLSTKLQIKDNVIFEGFCGDMTNEYLKYEIFVLSSKAEGMPNVLLEAMASGLACISTDCDFGPADLIEDGKNGMLVPVENKNELSKAILSLMRNKKLRKVIGKEAAKIPYIYSEENVVSKYIDFFKHVMLNRQSICFRIDDIHPRMDWDRFRRFMELLEEYKIYPLLGVIPACKDESICRNRYQKDFWDTIKKYQDDGCVIAMHGYDHIYRTKDKGVFPVNGFSEFAGISEEIQEEKISKGRELLENKGIYTDVFMAPGHSFDDTTIDILKKYCFKYVTDGFQKQLYERRGMTFIPVLLSIRSVEKRRVAGNIVTLVVHTNTIDDALLQRYRSVCEMHKDKLVSYKDIMTLEPSKYDAGYEKRKIKSYHRMNRLYSMVKKVLKDDS